MYLYHYKRFVAWLTPLQHWTHWFLDWCFKKEKPKQKRKLCNQCFCLDLVSKVYLSVIIAVCFYGSIIIPSKISRAVLYSPNLTASLATVTCAALSNFINVFTFCPH